MALLGVGCKRVGGYELGTVARINLSLEGKLCRRWRSRAWNRLEHEEDVQKLPCAGGVGRVMTKRCEMGLFQSYPFAGSEHRLSFRCARM